MHCSMKSTRCPNDWMETLPCFTYWLISPMYRTDMSNDTSNFQPMNVIKHLGESYHVTFVYMRGACPSVDNFLD